MTRVHPVVGVRLSMLASLRILAVSLEPAKAVASCFGYLARGFSAPADSGGWHPIRVAAVEVAAAAKAAPRHRSRLLDGTGTR